jgi:hypothetical protein
MTIRLASGFSYARTAPEDSCYYRNQSYVAVESREALSLGKGVKPHLGAARGL